MPASTSGCRHLTVEAGRCSRIIVGRRRTNNVEFKDAIALLALVVSVTGLFFAATQIRRTYRIERGKFLKELYAPFFLDDQIRSVYELIEGGASLFDDGSRTRNETKELGRQRAVERLFAQFEIICSLYYRKLLSRADLLHFDYNIQRVCLADGFDGYLTMLEEWRQFRGLNQGPYSSFIRYVNENRSRLCKRVSTEAPPPNNALHPTRSSGAERRSAGR